MKNNPKFPRHFSPLELEDRVEKIDKLHFKDPVVNTGFHRPQGIKGTGPDGTEFDSRWEFAFYTYHKTLCGDTCVRNRNDSIKYIDDSGKNCSFYPDFIVNGVYYEVKGRWRPKDLEKQRQCPQVVFVAADEMKKIIKELNLKLPHWQKLYTPRGKSLIYSN